MKQKTHPKDFIPKKEPLYTGYAANIDYDIMLERAVLGICLSEPRSYSQIYGVLNIECFYLDAHKVIFEAMHRVWEHGEPVDLLTVSRRLYDEGITAFGKDNTAYYFTDMSNAILGSAHLHQWCLKLRELSARRIMIQLTSTRFCWAGRFAGG